MRRTCSSRWTAIVSSALMCSDRQGRQALTPAETSRGVEDEGGTWAKFGADNMFREALSQRFRGYCSVVGLRNFRVIRVLLKCENSSPPGHTDRRLKQTCANARNAAARARQ